MGGENLYQYAPNPIGWVDPLGLSKCDCKAYQTYTKTNPETGKVYTGRTSGTADPEVNVARRDASHHKYKEGYGPAVLDKSTSNRKAIRDREQQMIEAHGGAKSQGGTSGNAINEVSEKMPNVKYIIMQL